MEGFLTSGKTIRFSIKWGKNNFIETIFLTKFQEKVSWKTKKNDKKFVTLNTWLR